MRKIILLFTLLATAIAARSQTVFFDSTGLPNIGYDAPLSPYYSHQAQRFTTDGAAGQTLTGLSLKVQTVYSGTWNPVVDIRAADGANPAAGTLVGSLTSNSGGISTGGAYYGFSGSVSLLSNTSYWVVFNFNGVPGDQFILNTRTGGTPTGAWYTAGDFGHVSNNMYGGWQTNSTKTLDMTISGVAVPEPSTYAACAGAAALGLAMWRRRGAKASVQA